MPKNKKQVNKELSIEEIKKQLEATSLELRDLRFKIEGSKTKNVKKINTLRKDIARMLTEINKNNNK